jgi:uncharacterized protein (UPF0218 family)
MLTLPEEHRSLFKEPFGVLYSSLDDILPLIEGKTLYAVGDVVTHNLQKRNINPAVAVIDGHTMRSPCSRMPVIHGESVIVKNPAGALTDELIHALGKAVNNPPVTIVVEGEEDLAVIPLVIAAPEGSVILYGQPYKGIVLRSIDKRAKEIAHQYLSHFVSSER